MSLKQSYNKHSLSESVFASAVAKSRPQLRALLSLKMLSLIQTLEL